MRPNSSAPWSQFGHTRRPRGLNRGATIATTEQRRRLRDAVLRALCNAVNREPSFQTTDASTIAAAIGADLQEVREAVQYLVDHELAEMPYLDGSIAITRRGVDRVEDLGLGEARRVLQAPEDPPPPRPQSNAVRSAAVLSVVERQEVEALLHLIEVAKAKGEILLEGDDAVALDAEEQAIEAALRSPNPNKGVVAAALRGIKVLIGDARSGAVGFAVGVLLGKLTG